MSDYKDFDKLAITLLENKISSFKHIETLEIYQSFPKRLVKNGVPKIYIVKHENDFLYVGTFKELIDDKTEVCFLYSFSLRFPFNLLTKFVKNNLQTNVKKRLIDLKKNIENESSKV